MRDRKEWKALALTPDRVKKRLESVPRSAQQNVVMLNGDSSERDADTHLEFTRGETLPKQASKTGISLNGRAAIDRTV